MAVDDLIAMFFADLKSYNSTCFRNLSITIDPADGIPPKVLKAFSSVVTRYFIFVEFHPELSQSETRLLYFGLKIDMISKFFSEYPDTTHIEYLTDFQDSLKEYLSKKKSLETTVV